MSSIFHPELHVVFEALGYIGGFVLYRRTAGPSRESPGEELQWKLLATCAISALLGSKMLGMLEQATSQGWNNHVIATAGGKTVVGGLLGGFAALRLLQVRGRTKSFATDSFVVPICVALAIARIGCFLAGLSDDTYGKATSLPWGIDFGDGVKRHPTQLYEVLFLIGLAWVLWGKDKRLQRDGQIWRVLITAYLVWRTLIDFLKPEHELALGMSVIQWACLIGLMALVADGWANRNHIQTDI